MNNVKKTAIIVLLILLSVSFFLPVHVRAATDRSMAFDFLLTAEGQKSLTVDQGDVIHVQLELKRTDEGKTGTYTLYSMQDELVFDSRYLAFVEGSRVVAPGFDVMLQSLQDGFRQRITVSRVVMSPSGAEVEDELVLLTFQLKALEVVEDQEVASMNHKVNARSGDSYLTSSNDLSITVGGTGPVLYSIGFDKGNDRAWGMAPSVGAKAQGETLALPANSFHLDGYNFDGWHDGQTLYGAGDLYTMPGKSVIFTARWKETPPLTTTTGPPSGEDSTDPAVTQPLTTSAGGTEVSTGPNQTTTASSASGESPKATDPAGQITSHLDRDDEDGQEGFDLVIDPGEADQRQIRVERTDQGLQLQGDDLSGLTFEIRKGGRRSRVILDTIEKQVLVKERPDGTYEILIDKDQDGIFETTIDQVALGINHLIWLVPLLLLLLSTAGIFLVLSRRKKKDTEETEPLG